MRWFSSPSLIISVLPFLLREEQVPRSYALAKPIRVDLRELDIIDCAFGRREGYAVAWDLDVLHLIFN